jgi:hypothetical protein
MITRASKAGVALCLAFAGQGFSPPLGPKLPVEPNRGTPTGNLPETSGASPIFRETGVMQR